MQVRLPYPHCAVCNAPVDDMQIGKSGIPGKVRVTALCHGQADECDVDIQFIADMQRPDVISADAIAFGDRSNG